MDGNKMNDYGSDISDGEIANIAENALAAIIAGKWYSRQARWAADELERHLGRYAKAMQPRVYENDFGPTLENLLPKAAGLRATFLRTHADLAAILDAKDIPFPDTARAYRKAVKKYGVPADASLDLFR